MEFLCWDRPVNLQDLRNRRNMISSNSMQIILQGAQSFMLDTVALSNEVNEMGYEGAMVIGPCYYALDQEKIFVYYDTLAKSIKGNLYIYNFPARSGHSIAPETLKKLVENNTNIKGLKDSVSEPNHTNELMPLYDMDSNFSLLFKKLMQHRGVEVLDRAIFPYNQMDEEVYKKAESLMDKVIEEYQNLK